MWCCEPSSVCNLYREFLLPRGPRARIHTGLFPRAFSDRWRAGVPRAPQPHPRPTPVTGNRVRCTIVEPRPAGSVSRLARGAGSHLPPLDGAQCRADPAAPETPAPFARFQVRSQTRYPKAHPSSLPLTQANLAYIPRRRSRRKSHSTASSDSRKA